MHLNFAGVNDAFEEIVRGIHTGDIKTITMPSRVGEVLQIPEPVTVTYHRPQERVLFNQARDANPFFHLFESLWMLAGRNDVAPLERYSSGIAKVASDDGKTFNGAYGYRWRKRIIWDRDSNASPGDVPIIQVDQLAIIIDQLKRKPESRRVVLQMWNVEDDLMRIDETKDVCCNTACYFLAEQGMCKACNGSGRGPVKSGSFTAVDESYACPKCKGKPHDQPRYLNMTVMNRSNDLIWGMLGANVVHFSFLQEYLAACIGLDVGIYHHFTNNLHVYTETNSGWHPEKWLAPYTRKDATLTYPIATHVPLVLDPVTFDRECAVFIDVDWSQPDEAPVLSEPFLASVAAPMCMAYACYKAKAWETADAMLELVQAEDWQWAGQQWINKRRANWERKQREGTQASSDEA